MYRHEEPIKMPRGTHFGSNYWIMYSKKLRRNVKAYSGLEHKNHLSLEMDPKVEYYCEQPHRVEAFIDGKKRNTVFDVWVLYKDGREEYQEVKYTSDIDNCIEQINLQKAWCLQNGFHYVIRTEKEIEPGSFYMRNLDMMYGKLRRMNVFASDKMMLPVIERIRKMQHPTVGQLSMTGMFSIGKTMDFLSLLYADGIISFLNMGKDPITNTTEVIYCGE